MQAKAMQQGGDPKAAPAANADALPGANFGPKYEAHVSEMQNKLDESGKRCALPAAAFLWVLT